MSNADPVTRTAIIGVLLLFLLGAGAPRTEAQDGVAPGLISEMTLYTLSRHLLYQSFSLSLGFLPAIKLR